ncbi:MAG: type IV secretion system protein [Rickettsiales bacterium]|nr:type IV secretion system protein [Rickettsiales bacterium]
MLSKLQELLGKKNAGETTQKNWYTDRHQSVLVQRNVLTVISLMAIIFSAVAIFFVYRNIPIVTVEPFVIQVEPRSGMTQVVRAATARELGAQESINNFFIVRYIKARETFNAAIQQNFHVVRLSSDPSAVFRQYAWEVNPNNPDSFLAKSGGAGTREVKIKSMARLDKNGTCADVTCQIQVRVRIIENAQSKTQYDRVILMEYTYTTLNLAVEERYLNPIGFRVLSYQVDNEVLQ